MNPDSSYPPPGRNKKRRTFVLRPIQPTIRRVFPRFYAIKRRTYEGKQPRLEPSARLTVSLFVARGIAIRLSLLFFRDVFDALSFNRRIGPSRTDQRQERRENVRTCGSRSNGINFATGCRWRIVVVAASPWFLVRAIRANTRSRQLLGTRVKAALVLFAAVQCPRGLLSGLGDIRI